MSCCFQHLSELPPISQSHFKVSGPKVGFQIDFEGQSCVVDGPPFLTVGAASGFTKTHNQTPALLMVIMDVPTDSLVFKYKRVCIM